MATNEFAASVQRNQWRMVVAILVHVVLEWTLMSLLLLDSVLSYLSYRFASYFGLKTPCLFCSRLEHHLHHPDEGRSPYRELLCDDHAAEVSLLAYCSIHRKLAEGADMCGQCSSSRTSPVAHDVRVKREGKGKGLESEFHSTDLPLKPSRVKVQAGDSIQEKGVLEDGVDHGLGWNQIEPGSCLPPPPPRDYCRINNAEAKGDEVVRMDPYLEVLTTTFGDDDEVEHRATSPVTLAGKSDGDLSKQPTRTKFEDANPKSKSMVAVVVEEQVKMQDSKDVGRTDTMANYEVSLGSEICATEQIDHPQFPQSNAPVDVSAENCGETENTEKIDKKDGEDADEISAKTRKCDRENVDDHENQAFVSLPAFVCDTKTDFDSNCEVTVKNEMCNEDQIDQYKPEEPSSTTPTHLGEVDVSLTEPLLAMDHGLNHHPSTSPRHNETEEDRAPETPNSFENMHNFCKTYLFCRKQSGTGSMDGSIASELDVNEASTVDQLKSALKDERRALNALYAELEEERSASAIAANQTMAMITRLQQEKAAMQMEALQYQRMMEERSEYDQEALHLLNDLVMKKEKEKQELEKMLEIYKNKVYLYKAKEMRMRSSNTNGRSCTSPALSSAGDDDNLCVDDPNEGEEHSYDPSDSNNVTVDGIVISGAHNEHSNHLSALDESLAYLEEKRINILEEIKVLEEKLFTMDDGEVSNVEELLKTHNLPEENGHAHDCKNEYQSIKLNSNHGSKKNGFCIGKRVLPLFDAVLSENEEGLEDHSLTNSVSKLTPERKNHTMEEEMDHVF